MVSTQGKATQRRPASSGSSTERGGASADKYGRLSKTTTAGGDVRGGMKARKRKYFERDENIGDNDSENKVDTRGPIKVARVKSR